VTHGTHIPWKKAGVMGIGLSGAAAAGFLARRGVNVIAVDARGRGQHAGRDLVLAPLGVNLRLGELAASDASVFSGCEVIIASPGVPPATPPLAGAVAAGIPVIAEVELASRHLRGVIVGITGSNGKSTVTSLTGLMLSDAGIPTRICGNIGVPLIEVAEADLALPEAIARTVHYVVELSSFQLEGIERLSPRVSVLLNLSPDHQDRYENMDDYYAAKARVFMNQRVDDIAVINWDDAPTRRIAAGITPRLIPFSVEEDLEEGAMTRGGRIILRLRGNEETVVETGALQLPGQHNLENVLASVAAAAHCGASLQAMARAAAGFTGLPHRLERVAEVRGVRYVNDSKATNVGSTLRALAAFEAPIVLLLGGYDKGGDFESLRAPLSSKRDLGGLRGVITFGKAGDNIASRIGDAVPGIHRAGPLAEAVRAAACLACAGDVVLLAPGCASFDAYTGFEKRGEDFRAIVSVLGSQTSGLR